MPKLKLHDIYGNEYEAIPCSHWMLLNGRCIYCSQQISPPLIAPITQKEEVDDEL